MTTSIGSSNKLQFCRVCGFEYSDFFPWGEDGRFGSNDICICCGVEFGYEDSKLEGIRKYRQEWITKGAPWSDAKQKPENWLLDEQLKNIPEEFR